MSANPSIPIVDSAGAMYAHAGGPLVCRVGPRTGWVAWLSKQRSFHFEGSTGASMTVAAERRDLVQDVAGRFYWYGWKKISGHRHKIYLGRAETLTLAKLEAAAAKLAQRALAEAPAISDSTRALLEPTQRSCRPRKRRKNPPRPSGQAMQEQLL